MTCEKTFGNVFFDCRLDTRRDFVPEQDSGLPGTNRPWTRAVRKESRCRKQKNTGQQSDRCT